MICNTQRADAAMRSGPDRAGFSRAIAGALVLALGGFASEPAWAAVVEDVDIVSDAGSDQTYAVDDHIEVDVTFDEVVHVDETDSELVLILAIGEHSRGATFIDGSGTPKLHFRYTVQYGDHDEDGVSIGPMGDPDEESLRAARIKDSDGTVASRRFGGLDADESHKVDGISPMPTDVDIVSTPEQGAIYHLGEDIEVDVTFDEIVHVNETVSELVLALSIGEHSRAARFVAGSGTDTLTFRYTVQDGDDDDDGISIGAGVGALQGARIEDFAGNAVVRTFPGLVADSAHRVDGVSPALTRVRIVSNPIAGGIYGLNEKIRLEVEFGEEVHVTEAVEDLALILSIGEYLRAATYVGGSGTETLTFRYTVQAGDSDDDGISIGPSALQGGNVEDAAGNAVERTFAGMAAERDHRVDGISPSFTSVRITSMPEEGDAYGLDEKITIVVAFGEVVHVTDTMGDLALVIAVGENLRSARFDEGSGTDTLSFLYVVQAGDMDDDGISIGPNALQGGAIVDAAGNEVVRDFEGLPVDGAHKVDSMTEAGAPPPIDPTLVPSVFDWGFASDAGVNDTYSTGDIIMVDVTFTTLVYITGEPPVLQLSIGAALKDALFEEGSGTRTLKFQYTVEAGDTDDDGISIGPNSLVGTIEDGNGNPVDLTLPAKPADPSHQVSAELMLYPLALKLVVGQAQTINLADLLLEMDVTYGGDFEWASDDPGVATVDLSDHMLTITSVVEGTATITVKATDAAIFLFFGVTVATSAAETAVLEDALAAVGRGLLASAGSTIGERLEVTDANSSDDWGGRGVAPVTAAAWPQWSALDGAVDWGSPPGYGHRGMDDPYLQGSTGYTPAQWLRGARFEMPLRGFGNPVSSWAVWGAGDWHAFEGEGDDGLYNGSLASAYLGVDARGDGWVAGASVSRAMADASYEYGGTAGGKGRLETDLNVIHPYVQWAFRDRGKMWAILGFGTGEATAEREGQQGASEPSELSMRMGLGGIRYSFGRLAGFDFAVRGDAGFAQLETDEGPRAVQGLAVDVQRLRIGAEASLPMALRGIPVSPFINVAGRYDGGDGASGGGVELAGGFRYQGSAVSLEVKGRTLAMHADESYSEEGVKATLVVGPDSRKGFRLLLSPRWGGAPEAMDIFRSQGHPFAGALRRENRGWGLGSRVSYGFDMWRRPGTIMPFGEVDLSREDYRRARLGVSYELASAILGLPHRLEISGESTDSDRHGTLLRFLLTGQANF